MADGHWKRVAGFVSEAAYREFEAHLDAGIVRGEVRLVETDPNYGRAMIYGGRWFENPENGEVWRLVAPEPPFMGVWERVLGYGPDSFRDAPAAPAEVTESPDDETTDRPAAPPRPRTPQERPRPTTPVLRRPRNPEAD